MYRGLRWPKQIAYPRLKLSSGSGHGMFATSTLALEIVDHDGILASLFAAEAKTAYKLNQTTDLQDALVWPSSIFVEGPGGSINPANGHVSTEAIGPARQRRYYHCFPWRGVGEDHNGVGPSREVFSTEPVTWAGRRAALYEIVQNDDGTWDHWLDQYDADNSRLIWYGKMRDEGQYQGGNTWRIQFDGPESLLKKPLGAQTHARWMKITDVETTLTSDESMIAVGAYSHHLNTSNAQTVYDSSDFTALGALTGDRYRFGVRIQLHLGDVLNGTISDWGGPTHVYDSAANFDCDIDPSSGIFTLRQANTDEGGITTNDRLLRMEVCLHEKVWRTLGFEPYEQSLNQDGYDVKQVNFQAMEVGESVAYGANAVGLQGAPVPGYWRAVMYSSRPGFLYLDQHVSEVDPPGRYAPVHGGAGVGMLMPGNPFRLDQDPNIVADKVQWYFDGTTVNGGSPQGAKMFALRGKRATGTFGGAGQLVEKEVVDVVSVARVVFQYTSQRQIAPLGLGEYVLEVWDHPHVYGVEGDFLGQQEWAMTSEDDGAIECVPITSYCRNSWHDRLLAPDLFSSLLVSTGTSPGWGAASGVAGPTTGLNNPPTATGERQWGGDIWSGEQGLAIPHQLVEGLDVLADEWAKPTGALESDLNRTALAFIGSQPAQKVLQSLVQARGLMLSWKGGKFGAQFFEAHTPDDATVSIGEAALALGNAPWRWRPKQDMRSLGHLDAVNFRHRRDAVTGEFVGSLNFPALDPGASSRKGDLDETIEAWDVLFAGSQIGEGDWVPDAFGLHSRSRPATRARRHFTVLGVPIKRDVGRTLGIGTKVTFTNPWVLLPNGAKGCTNAAALVTGVTAVFGPHAHYKVDLLVFAEQFGADPRFMPIGRVSAITGTTVTLTSADTAAKFMAPSWSEASSSAEAHVKVIYDDRTGWRSSGNRQIASRSGANIVLTNALTGIPPNARAYLVMASWAGQTAGNWVRTYGVPVTDEDNYAAGVVSGLPLKQE